MRCKTLRQGLSALLMTALTLAILGVAWLQTASGKGWLAHAIEAGVSTPNRRLEIGTLEGAIPFAPVATDVRLSDLAGPWLSLDRAAIRLDPLAIFRGVVRLESIELGRLEIPRRAYPTPHHDDRGGALPTAWPAFPIPVTVDRLTLTELALGAPILGEPTSFRIQAAARFGHPKVGSRLDLKIRRTDEATGNLLLQARYVPEGARLTSSIRVEETERPILGRLLGLDGLPALSIHLSGDGPLDHWRAELRIDGGDGLEVKAPVAIMAEDRGHRILVDAHGDLAALASERLRRLVEPDISLQASLFLGADHTLRLEQIALVGGLGTATLAGELNLADLAARFLVRLDTPDLARIHEWADETVAGGARLAVAADWDGTTATVLAGAELQHLSTRVPALNDLLGPSPRLSLAASFQADKRIHLHDLALSARALELSASGALADETMVIDWQSSLPDLGVLHPALAGALTAFGRLTGIPDDPGATVRLVFTDADLGGYPVPRGRLDLLIADLLTRPVGEVALTADIAGLPAQSSAALRVEEEAVVIDPLALRLASLTATGAVTLDPGTRTADGGIFVQVGDLGDLAPILGTPLFGHAEAELSLSRSAGRQVVDLQATAFRTGLSESVKIERANLSLELTDPLGAVAVAAQSQAQGVQVGALALDGATATAEGRWDGLALALELTGESFAASTRAELTLADRLTRIEVADLQARYADVRAALARPARVTIGPEGVGIADLVLESEGGRLTAEGRFGDASDLVIGITDLPLGLARLATPDLDLAGRLDGRLALRRAGRTPRASGEIQAKGLTLGVLREAGIPPLAIATTLGWNGATLSLQSRLTGEPAAPIQASADLAAPADPETGLPIMDPNARLTGRLVGDLPLALLNPLLAARGDRLDGTLALDLRLSGRLADPRIGGRLSVNGGSLRSPLTGLSLQDIRLRGQGDGDRLTVAELSANTPEGGCIQGLGSIGIRPETGFPISLSLDLDDALVVDNDVVRASVQGAIGASGNLVQSLDLDARLVIREAEIRLPDRLPPSIPTLEVVEVNVPPELKERRLLSGAKRADTRPPIPISLDLAIRAPQRVLVRGRGLDAEVAGEVRVQGRADAPDIRGGFELRHGSLEMLGRRFDFDEGMVTLPEDGSLDAEVRFVTRTKLSDGFAQIRVSGRASAPEIHLESVPELPPDEVLARILFGDRDRSLSALESLQLLRSALELTGRRTNPGVLEGLRRRLGLDQLDINHLDRDAGSPALRLRGRLAEAIELGAQQGLRAGSGRARVEIQLTPGISLETQVGTENTGRTGVRMEWEY